MNPYELMMIFDPNTGEEKISETIVKIEAKIKDFGGEIEKVDKPGIRKLASRFKKAKKLVQGYYVIVYFNGEPSIPGKLQGFLKVNESIVRYSILKPTPVKEPEFDRRPAEVQEGAVNVGEIKDAAPASESTGEGEESGQS